MLSAILPAILPTVGKLVDHCLVMPRTSSVSWREARALSEVTTLQSGNTAPDRSDISKRSASRWAMSVWV